MTTKSSRQSNYITGAVRPVTVIRGRRDLFCRRNSTVMPRSSRGPMCLQYCTEGLGSESSDAFDPHIFSHLCHQQGDGQQNQNYPLNQSSAYKEVYPSGRRDFPPPLTCLVREAAHNPSSMNHRHVLKPHRENGRFVLEETTVPTSSPFLRAHRQNGHLRLKLLHCRSDSTDSSLDNGHLCPFTKNYLTAAEQSSMDDQEDEEVACELAAKKESTTEQVGGDGASPVRSSPPPLQQHHLKHCSSSICSNKIVVGSRAPTDATTYWEFCHQGRFVATT